MQGKNKQIKSNFTPKLIKWHCTLREDLIKLCSDLPDYNSERGPNPPSKMLNINQIPLPFSINLTTT